MLVAPVPIPADVPVRYIKLGSGGLWERECLERQVLRFGFGTEDPERFAQCVSGRWDQLEASLRAEGRAKGTATSIVNQARGFFEDGGIALWITFIGEQLWWGRIQKGSPPRRHPDGDGTERDIVRGWQGTSLDGEPLTKDRLSGWLTKLALFRGTSLEVRPAGRAAYAIRRINGQKSAEVEQAIEALEHMRESAVVLMRNLDPRDFETLVDLVFTASGWRRLGAVGGVEKGLDIDLLLPSTGERAFVQVKSDTSQNELSEYAGKIGLMGPFSRMFFVYHSYHPSTQKPPTTDDPRVTVVDPVRLAQLAVDAGLVGWLIGKVS